MDAGQVRTLCKAVNDQNPSKPPIPCGQQRGGSGGTERVWKQIQARMKETCDDGRKECIAAHLLERPKAPETWTDKPDQWLTSTDVNLLEKRFEKLFDKYKYVGSFPIDFNEHNEVGKCLVSTLCSLDLRSLYKKGYHHIGLVFNTDVSTGPGQHWISAFCDIDPELEYPRMTYFDSYAHKPEPQIAELMNKWKEQWDKTGIHSKPMQLTYNGTRHQKKNTECGMYSIYFHYSCLMGIPMNKRIPDEVVQGLRGLLFKVPK